MEGTLVVGLHGYGVGEQPFYVQQPGVGAVVPKEAPSELWREERSLVVVLKVLQLLGSMRVGPSVAPSEVGGARTVGRRKEQESGIGRAWLQ